MALVPQGKERKQLTLSTKQLTQIPQEIRERVSNMLVTCLDPPSIVARATVPNTVRVRAQANRLIKKGRGVGALPQLSLQHHYESLQESGWQDRCAAENRVKHILTEWARSYDEELSSHEAITVGVQIVLSQIKSTTEFLGTPNVLRGAVVFMLMDKIVATMGRYEPVMSELMSEMRLLVFIPHASKPLPNSLTEYLETNSYFEQYIYLIAQRKEFERLSELVHRNLNNKIVVMDRCVVKWQKMLVTAMFVAWRNTVQRVKFRNIAMKDFTRRTIRRDVLQSAFYAWRLVCANLRVDVERTQLIENMDTLLQTESMTYMRLAETEDKLDEARTLLGNLREEVGVLRDRNMHLQESVTSQEFRASQWRHVSSEYAKYVLRLSESITQIDKRTEEDPTARSIYHVVEQTLLGWVNSTLVEHNLQRALKRRVCDFARDLKDCAAYILLLHCYTKGEKQMSLMHLEHFDFHRRAEAVLVTMGCIGLNCGITSEDLISGVPDYHVTFLYTLWNHFYIPPVILTFEEFATQSLSSASSARQAFVDDLREFTKKLTEIKTAHQTWLAHRNFLSRFVQTLLLNRSRGMPVKLITKQEESSAAAHLKQFTTLPLSKLMEVFQLLPHHDPAKDEQTTAENSTELMNAQEVLMRYFTYTRRVYRHYSTLGLEKPRKLAMDMTQFHRFCLDTKIIGGGFSKKDSANIFKETKERNQDFGMDEHENMVSTDFEVEVRTGASEGASEGRGVMSLEGDQLLYNPEDMLLPNEFSQILCRIAIRKFCPEPLKPNAVSPLPLGEALENLYLKHIIPKARIADSSEFKQEICGELVQTVLKKTRRNTMKVFKHYSTRGTGEDSGRMTFEDFGELVKDANLLDTVLNQSAIQEIFMQFQERTEDGDGAPSTSSMVYSEFEEALVCLAAFKFPAPYVPLHNKVSSFLDTLLLPELSKIIKIK